MLPEVHQMSGLDLYQVQSTFQLVLYLHAKLFGDFVRIVWQYRCGLVRIAVHLRQFEPVPMQTAVHALLAFVDLYREVEGPPALYQVWCLSTWRPISSQKKILDDWSSSELFSAGSSFAGLNLASYLARTRLCCAVKRAASVGFDLQSIIRF
jgi:hypothetical protein